MSGPHIHPPVSPGGPTVADAIKARRDLEADIATRIREFENRFGATIASVGLATDALGRRVELAVRI